MDESPIVGRIFYGMMLALFLLLGASLVGDSLLAGGDRLQQAWWVLGTGVGLAAALIVARGRRGEPPNDEQ